MSTTARLAYESSGVMMDASIRMGGHTLGCKMSNDIIQARNNTANIYNISVITNAATTKIPNCSASVIRSLALANAFGY